MKPTWLLHAPIHATNNTPCALLQVVRAELAEALEAHAANLAALNAPIHATNNMPCALLQVVRAAG